MLAYLDDIFIYEMRLELDSHTSGYGRTRHATRILLTTRRMPLIKTRLKQVHRHDSGQNREMSAGLSRKPQISAVSPLDEKEMGADDNCPFYILLC